MSIDLLPFSAFALESCASPAPVAGEAHTLTLKLALARLRSPYTPMSGIVVAGGSPMDGSKALRACVVAADPSPLTITFA